MGQRVMQCKYRDWIVFEGLDKGCCYVKGFLEFVSEMQIEVFKVILFLKVCVVIDCVKWCVKGIGIYCVFKVLCIGFCVF